MTTSITAKAGFVTSLFSADAVVNWKTEELKALIDMTENDTVSKTHGDKMDQNQGEKTEQNKDTTPCSSTSDENLSDNAIR